MADSVRFRIRRTGTLSAWYTIYSHEGAPGGMIPHMHTKSHQEAFSYRWTDSKERTVIFSVMR
jgi:hypothetical protein